ncbi:hypothetical protein M9458_043059, partial [Cirrhinus mrigala]
LLPPSSPTWTLFVVLCPEPPPELSACLPASLFAAPSPSHIHSFVLLLSPPPSLPLSLQCEVAPLSEGANCHTHGPVLLCFPSL